MLWGRDRTEKGADAGQVAPTALPPGCAAYRISPVLTEMTIPSGLLRAHRTKPDTWALIRVLEGRLLYRVLDPPSERVLDPAEAPGVVEPGVPHEVAPLGPVRFQVEFHRVRETANCVGAAAASLRPKG